MKHNNSSHNDYKDDEILQEIKSIFDIDNDDNANIMLKNKFHNLNDLNNSKVKSSIKTIRQCEGLFFFSNNSHGTASAYSSGVFSRYRSSAPWLFCCNSRCCVHWLLTLAGAVICSGLLIYRNHTKNSLEKTLSSGPTEPLMTSTKIHRTSKTVNKNPFMIFPVRRFTGNILLVRSTSHYQSCHLPS